MNNFYHFFYDGLLDSNEKPSEVVLAADAAGILPPELTALKGRPQPPQYHPEGDAFVHTLLVIDRAFDLDASTMEMFGALVHDLGKAVTPDDNLPHHYNHEALGVPIVRKLGQRNNINEDVIQFGQLCAKEHLNVHKFLELRPVKKVDFLERVAEVGNRHFNFIRNEQRQFPLIENLVLVAQADAQGRGPTLIDKPYPQAKAAVDAWYIIRDVHHEDPVKQRMIRAKAVEGKFGK